MGAREPSAVWSVACRVFAIAVLSLTMGAQEPGPEPRAVLEVALAENGVRLELEEQRVSFRAHVLVREELLEYLLVGPGGSAHESLFATEAAPSLLNTALLALGLEPGSNATWLERDPRPSEEELRAGVLPWDVSLPEGDGIFLHALWKEGDEVYFFRVEDLLRNLATGRTMRRHPWVYLGSRFEAVKEGAEEVFVADREQNLVNVAFFGKANTLITAALPICVDQTIWVGNSWLLPERGWPVVLVASRRPLAAPPDSLVAGLEDGSPGEDER